MKQGLLPLLILVFVVLPFSTVSAATDPGVKPDNFFYVFDTTFEKINLLFTFNSASKAEKALSYAEERIAEVNALSEQENMENLIKKAVSNYKNKISLATEKSKDIKNEYESEKILKTILDQTKNDQEFLTEILGKSLADNQEALKNAIEVSRQEYEKVSKEVKDLNKEVGQLKDEIKQLQEAINQKTQNKETSLKTTQKVVVNQMPLATPDLSEKSLKEIKEELEEQLRRAQTTPTPMASSKTTSQPSNTPVSILSPSPSPTPIATDSATPLPQTTPTPTPTPIPTQTPSPSPTSTPTPSLTPTPTPTPQPGSLSVTIDSATPSLGELMACSTQSTLAVFRLTRTSGNEPIEISDVTIQGIASSFGNVSLNNTSPSSAGTFHFSSPLVISPGNSASLTLKGDIGKNIAYSTWNYKPVYHCDGYSDNSTHTFQITNPSDIVAKGQISNLPPTVVVSSAISNPQTILFSRLNVSSTPLGTTTNRPKSSQDDLAVLRFSSEYNISGTGFVGPKGVYSVTFTFDGSVPASIPGFYNTGVISPVTFPDRPPSTVSLSCSNCPVQLIGSGDTLYPTSSGPNSLTFSLGAGGYTQLTLRVNTAGISGGTLSAKIVNRGDVSGSDGVNSGCPSGSSYCWFNFRDNPPPFTTYGLGLPPSTILPITIQSVSY